MKKKYTLFYIAFLISSSPFLRALDVKKEAHSAYVEATHLYKNQQYKEALVYLQRSFSLSKDGKTANNIGLVYKKLGDINQSLVWFAKAISFKNPQGYYNLGLYYNKIKEYDKAIKLFIKATKGYHIKSIKQLAYIYLNIKKDKLMGAAYTLALIDKIYTLNEILNYLKKKYAIQDSTLKRAYTLQKKLLPNPYIGSLGLKK